MRKIDIKNALKCCINDNRESCEKCPYYKQPRGWETPTCYNKLMRDALALIEKQQKAIERLMEYME